MNYWAVGGGKILFHRLIGLFPTRESLTGCATGCSDPRILKGSGIKSDISDHYS
jgi:hypothetical protein